MNLGMILVCCPNTVLSMFLTFHRAASWPLTKLHYWLTTEMLFWWINPLVLAHPTLHVTKAQAWVHTLNIFWWLFTPCLFVPGGFWPALLLNPDLIPGQAADLHLSPLWLYLIICLFWSAFTHPQIHKQPFFFFFFLCHSHLLKKIKKNQNGVCITPGVTLDPTYITPVGVLN